MQGPEKGGGESKLFARKFVRASSRKFVRGACLERAMLPQIAAIVTERIIVASFALAPDGSRRNATPQASRVCVNHCYWTIDALLGLF